MKNTVTEEDQRVLFELGLLRSEKAKKASADGSYRSALSRLEANGLNRKAAKDSIKIAESGETADTLEYLNHLTRYLRLLRVPIQRDQIDMFETAPEAQPIEERAFEDGLATGVLGDGQDKNPHALESKAGKAWVEGWHEGTAFRAEQVKEAEEPSADDGDGEPDEIDPLGDEDDQPEKPTRLDEVRARTRAASIDFDGAA